MNYFFIFKISFFNISTLTQFEDKENILKQKMFINYYHNDSEKKMFSNREK